MCNKVKVSIKHTGHEASKKLYHHSLLQKTSYSFEQTKKTFAHKL